jgi:histidinol-phosphatase (PHP family)
VPIFKQTGIKNEWNMREELLDKYISEVNEAKRRWEGKLTVLLGLEIDYIKGHRSAQDSDIKALNLDYIIGSVHYVIPPNGAQMFAVDDPPDEFEKNLNEGFNGDGEALMNCYYDAVAQMIETGGFDILGHADIIKKNCQEKKYWKGENEALRQKEIARAAAKANIVVEVNTGGLNRKKTQDVYPSESFLRCFHEQKVPAVIAADAHCAADINGNYDIALQTLVCAGFSEHIILFGKNNEKILWKNEKIL